MFQLVVVDADDDNSVLDNMGLEEVGIFLSMNSMKILVHSPCVNSIHNYQYTVTIQIMYGIDQFIFNAQ